MAIQDQVDNPMWFDTSVINQDFITGYCQAVYQMRLKLTSMDQEPREIRAYTEYMIDQLNKTHNMKGTLKNTKAGWQVEHIAREQISERNVVDMIPLHPNDVKRIHQDSQRFDNIEARIAANPIVEFYIVKEYTDAHTNQVQAYAKLVEPHISDDFQIGPDGAYEHDYPELEGTINLCNDMISKAVSDQAIDTEADKHYDNNGSDVLFAMGARWCRDQLTNPSELDQIKRYKDGHVKEQNYMIATLYKEIERLLSKHAQTTSFDTPSQTEISDEEIEKSISYDSIDPFVEGYIKGAQWYREQVKSKQ